MGWIEAEIDGRTIHHHGGDAIVMTSWTMLDREAGIGASLLYNGASLHAYRFRSKSHIVHNLLRLIAGKELSEFGRPKESDPTANDYELPVALLGRYAGEYVSEGGFRATVEEAETSVGGGRGLIVRAGSLDLDYIYEVDFASESSIVLRNLSGATPARFLLTPAGKVTGISGGLFGGVYRRVDPDEFERLQSVTMTAIPTWKRRRSRVQDAFCRRRGW